MVSQISFLCNKQAQDNDNIIDENENDTHLIAEIGTGRKWVKIIAPGKMVPNLDLENEEEWKNHYGPRRREVMRPRRRHADVPSKFCEHVHTMLQVGEDFDVYEEAHVNVNHRNDKNRKMVMSEPTTHLIITQYHVLKGLNVFDKERTDAVLSELQQLHDRMVMNAKNPEEMTKQNHCNTSCS